MQHQDINFDNHHSSSINDSILINNQEYGHLNEVSACQMLSPPECLGLSKIDHTDSTNHNNYGTAISGMHPSHFNHAPHNTGLSFNHPSNGHHHLNMRQRQLIGSSLLNIESIRDRMLEQYRRSSTTTNLLLGK